MSSYCHSSLACKGTNCCAQYYRSKAQQALDYTHKEKRTAQEQLEAVHAAGDGRSGLYLGNIHTSLERIAVDCEAKFRWKVSQSKAKFRSN